MLLEYLAIISYLDAEKVPEISWDFSLNSLFHAFQPDLLREWDAGHGQTALTVACKSTQSP